MNSAGRIDGAVLLTARWIVGHENGRHRLLEHGQIVFVRDKIVFVGFDYPGAVAKRIDCGNALIGPGFVDLDALADLDTTILGFDNQPAWRKGASGRRAICAPGRTRCIRPRSWRSRSATPSPC